MFEASLDPADDGCAPAAPPRPDRRGVFRAPRLERAGHWGRTLTACFGRLAEVDEALVRSLAKGPAYSLDKGPERW
jgi:hypothetical protein